MSKTRTILITGCSTGIGHAACELFAEKGWRVLAGSRQPEKMKFSKDAIESIELDVADPASVAKAMKVAGDIDVIVNNAGYGLLLPFEDTPMEEVEKMYRVNVFGLMDACKHAARMFRERGAGIIINIASVVGRVGVPFYTGYAGSKWAVEGFSESLAHELRPFGVHVKLVEPGGTRTEFHIIAYEHAFSVSDPYRERFDKKLESRLKNHPTYDTPENVAQKIYEAATDGEWKLRYPLAEAVNAEKYRSELGEEGFWQRQSEKLGSL